MNIITVAPITRRKVPDKLHYFTAKNVSVGAIVTIPIRANIIHGIVLDVHKASDLKTEIRNAPYEIRKMDRVKTEAFFTDGFVEAVKLLSRYYATSEGSIFGSVISEVILENANRIAPPLPLQSSFLQTSSSEAETFAVQGDDDDRISSWKSLIRQQFAKKRSVAIYVPTIEDVRQFFDILEKGIEGYIYSIHGSMTKKKILDTWSDIATTNHPVVVIATPSFLALPRNDFETVIIERENGRGWMGMKSPQIDLRHACETLSRQERKSVYLSDLLLRTETLHRVDNREVAHGTPFKWRSISTGSDIVVSMKRDDEKSDKPLGFRIFSRELEDIIRKNIDENTNLFMMTARRGLATLTVCDDCENIISCDKCNTPLVSHSSKLTGKNFFMCHACGEKKIVNDTCSVCGGHRLSPMGIGTDRVKKELQDKFENINVFQIDADTTTTEKQVSDTVRNWRAKPGSVLIGTELAVNHLGGQVDHVAVVTLDSLFAIPDFRIEERLMYLLTRLRTLATRTFLVQTRRIDERVFEYGAKGNLSDFYRSVVADRKKYDYPPFSTIIKISIEGKKEVIAKQMGELQAYFSPFEIEVFPAFTSSDKGASIIHGMIRIADKSWPDTDLVDKLMEMPPEVHIKINPESILN